MVSVVSWLITLSSLTYLKAFAIDDVRVFGADADIAPILHLAALKQLDGRYMHIFSRDSALTYPKQDMISAIKNASPRIDDITINRDD